MKKLLKISIAAIGIFMITALIIIPMTAQSATQNGGGKAIPESVMKIANKSCVKCHTEGGNGMALMHLNLSNWDKYSPEKQASKAKDMCKMVTKDKMPPKISGKVILTAFHLKPKLKPFVTGQHRYRYPKSKKRKYEREQKITHRSEFASGG